MRTALLCDVDQAVYHVGDELIATAQTRALSRRGHEVVRISRRENWWPAQESDHGELIPALTFPWGVEDRTRYLAEIRAVLAGDSDALPSHDKLFGIIERMRSVDALVIGGGGSLNSRYGWLLSERLATALVARHLGQPVVLSGQSLGPELSVEDRELLRELLAACDLVVVRDEASLRIARQLVPEHPRLVRTADDALLLDLAPAGEREPRAAVTVGSDPAPFPSAAADRIMAAVIDRLAAETGLGVELLPHMGTREGGADVAAHARIAELCDAPAHQRGIERDLEVARRTASASFVLTTRFHPVVFAIAGAAPLLALPLNRYGTARIDGALETVGLRDAAVPFAALWDPGSDGPAAGLDRWVGEAVAAAPRLQELFAQRRPQLQQALEAWWDALSDHLHTRARAGAGIGAAAGTAQAPGDLRARPVTPDFACERLWPAPARRELAPVTGRDAEPTVAIIMRTRDRARLLDRAVQDVLAQTRGDWELRIVNDAGDPRAVREVLDRYEHEALGRIGVLDREESRGMEAASNAGIADTSAPLIAIHDDDDTWDPAFLQQTVAHLQAHPEQLAVAVRTTGIHERLTPGGIVEDHRWLSWEEISGFRLLEHIEINRTVPIAVLHRRSAHEQLGMFDEGLPVVGDYDFHLRLLSTGPVGFIERPLAQWRHRLAAAGADSNSIFARADDHRHYDRILRERHLGEWVRENGVGLPMYMAYLGRHEADRAVAQLREQLDRIEEKLDAQAAAGPSRNVLESAEDLLRRGARRARREVGRRLPRRHGRD